MKALILPKAPVSALKPLTTWMPEYLLPVVNKPVGEHLVEWLLRHGIEQIIMSLKHMPYETEDYFGDGARWGVTISYLLQKDYDGLPGALRRLGSKVSGPILCLPGNVLTDLDLSRLIEVHQEYRGEATLARPGPVGSSSPVRPGTPEDWRKLDDWPCILTESVLPILSRHMPHALQGDSPPPMGIENLTLHTYRAPFMFFAISSPNDFLEANLLALKGQIPGLIIPGKAVEPGIFIGKHTRIHSGAVLSPPVLIGEGCSLGKGSTIGEGTVVCNRVMIDENASVRESVVLSHTYLGPYSNIRKVIVKKNCLVQTPSLQEICMGDDLILGDLSKATVSARLERLWNVLLAIFFIVLTSPVIVCFYLYHLAFPSKKFLASEERYGGIARQDLSGESVRQVFKLYSFRSKNPMVQRLPGLLNVLKGDLSLVGVSPQTREESERTLEEWQQMRFNAPPGLFRPWDVETRGDLEWEEKMVMETYYAATRSFRGDLIILAKSLLVRRTDNRQVNHRND